MVVRIECVGTIQIQLIYSPIPTWFPLINYLTNIYRGYLVGSTVRPYFKAFTVIFHKFGSIYWFFLIKNFLYVGIPPVGSMSRLWHVPNRHCRCLDIKNDLKHPWFEAEIVISTEKRDYSDENKLRCSSYLIDIISRKLDSNCKWENFTNGTIPNLPNIFNKLYTSYIAWLHEHRLVNNHRIKIITHNWLYNIGSIKAFNQSHEKKG